jgi:hypothetical protein
MITERKYRMLTWMVVILLALNVATIASLVYHSRQPEKNLRASQEDQISAKSDQGTRFFRERLNLSPDQVIRFREVNRNYNRAANLITNRLERLRSDMVEEMGKAQPDTARLNVICREVGKNHENLKRHTIDHFFRMKTLCTEEQAARLTGIFMEMVQKQDTAVVHQGRRRGGPWRGGRE